jgi:hypothetical protein
MTRRSHSIEIDEATLNINMATPRRHYRHDATRFPAGWKKMGNRPDPVWQTIDRFPDWFKGGVAGGVGGAVVAGE